MKIEFQNSVKNWVFCAFYQTSNRLDKPLVVVVVVVVVGGGGVCVRVGGIVWNTLKGGRNRKDGGETKILKGGQVAWRGGCFNKVGGWNYLNSAF